MLLFTNKIIMKSEKQEKKSSQPKDIDASVIRNDILGINEKSRRLHFGNGKTCWLNTDELHSKITKIFQNHGVDNIQQKEDSDIHSTINNLRESVIDKNILMALWEAYFNNGKEWIAAEILEESLWIKRWTISSIYEYGNCILSFTKLEEHWYTQETWDFISSITNHYHVPLSWEELTTLIHVQENRDDKSRSSAHKITENIKKIATQRAIDTLSNMQNANEKEVKLWCKLLFSVSFYESLRTMQRVLPQYENNQEMFDFLEEDLKNKVACFIGVKSNIGDNQELGWAEAFLWEINMILDTMDSISPDKSKKIRFQIKSFIDWLS